MPDRMVKIFFKVFYLVHVSSYERHGLHEMSVSEDYEMQNAVFPKSSNSLSLSRFLKNVLYKGGLE